MKRTILALAVVLMLAGCGGGSKSVSMREPAPEPAPTPTPEPTSTTWEQLPSLVDSMDRKENQGKAAPTEFPGWGCDIGFRTCQAEVKAMIAAATEQTPITRWPPVYNIGTIRRFQGTRTVQTNDGNSFTHNYWGGWLENSIFIAGTIGPVPAEPLIRTPWTTSTTMGIKDTNPVTGRYRGHAVDMVGNWGTSELTYTSGGTGGGHFSLTLAIPGTPRRDIIA